MTNDSSSRLSQFLAHLERDPNNCNLLGDAALKAFEAQAYATARELLERHRTLKPLPPALDNLDGLIELAEGNYRKAILAFERLRAAGIDEAPIRFNLAWAKANVGDYEAALRLLDDEAVASAPRGPSLKIHVLHHLNRYEDAISCGAELAKRFPENRALFGALATLALDADRADLAAEYAQRAADHPEGQIALGFLMLADSDGNSSFQLFDESLKVQPGSPRAWLGKGLSLLLAGKASAAAEAIENAATLFHDHIGSWVAAGWAHFLAEDVSAARRSFERARSLDANFSEAHGGLAVLDAIEGHADAAQHHCEIALRLDRNSLGGALAKSVLMEKKGHQDAAQSIRKIALSMPLGPSGRTLAQALVGIGGKRRYKLH